MERRVALRKPASCKLQLIDVRLVSYTLIPYLTVISVPRSIRHIDNVALRERLASPSSLVKLWRNVVPCVP